MSKKKHAGGRPRKFSEASRPVTVTLPARILKMLAAVDHARARAIARVTELALRDHQPPRSAVEVARVAPGIGMLVVPPSAALRAIPFVQLVEVAPSRYLITIPTGTPTSEIELALQDKLEELAEGNAREREIVAELLTQLRRYRKSAAVSKAEVLFVGL